MLRVLGGLAAAALLVTGFYSSSGGAPKFPAPSRGAVPLVGFSFSDRAAIADGLAPVPSLRTLLRRLSPDLVRLPVYWDEVEGVARGAYDWSPIDSLLAEVTAHNAASARGRQTRVVLVVGVRNLGYPEVYVPSWAGYQGSVPAVMRSPSYLDYVGNVFARYRDSPLLYAWQVENEPLDQTNSDLGLVAEPYDALADLVASARAADPVHPIVVTSYDSAAVSLDKHASSRLSWLWAHLPVAQPVGHPLPALSLGDALGLDVYVVTPTTPLSEASAVERIAWKQQALDYWSGVAASQHKQLWVTEMQAAPWLDTPGFTPDDLLASARAYAGYGEDVVLLWGVELWLNSPEWMAAGRQAVAVLRGRS